jgi:hypothetical protein
VDHSPRALSPLIGRPGWDKSLPPETKLFPGKNQSSRAGSGDSFPSERNDPPSHGLFNFAPAGLFNIFNFLTISKQLIIALT